MSNQTHKVTTDALDTLGMIIDETAARDAIHLAVEPVVAEERLSPGMHVALRDGRAVYSFPGVGIVDPFLTRTVEPGERFWLVVLPRQITSLRHVWSHPSFPDVIDPLPRQPDKDKSASEAWIRDFAERVGLRYETLIAAAVGKLPTGLDDHVTASVDEDYFNIYGTDATGEIPPEFWDHVETVTGVKCPNRPPYFSCSC